VPESFLGVPSPNHSGVVQGEAGDGEEEQGEKGQEGEVEVEGAA
jgi:hypothetical protein